MNTAAARWIGVCLWLLVAGCGRSGPDIDAGRRIYRDGILSSGEPLTAIVAGDVPVTGTQFSCASCHGRSGMGTGEATYIVPPIAGPFLFNDSPQPRRPAYTTESLAKVLREGTTSAGRTLEAGLMPRYQIDDADVARLAAYLRILSSQNSPGVDESTIHFATVITDGVDPADRQAVMTVLTQYAEEINRQTRNDAERWDRGYTPESQLPTVFREWVVDEWLVTGPRETWGGQLQHYYEQAPVFAMLSGLGVGDWDEVSRFCENREIPCLFPSTRVPITQDGDFYTFYYYRGLLLEAQLIARQLSETLPARLVQVYCDDTVLPAVATLRQLLDADGIVSQDIMFDCRDPLPVPLLAAALSDENSVAVLWLQRDQYPAALPPGRLYLSSTMLEQTLPETALDGSQPVFLVHPYKLPGSTDSALSRFAVWAKTRGLEISRPNVQAEAFFACFAANHVLKHMGRFFVRDFMLDMLDHSQSLVAYVPIHPRATLGPGQRFLSKGGYILPIVDGEVRTADAEWLIP